MFSFRHLKMSKIVIDLLFTFKHTLIFYLWLFILVRNFPLINSEDETKSDLSSDICRSKSSCKECLQTKSCGWCLLQEFDGEHCLLSTSDAVKNCSGKNFYFPNNTYKVIDDKDFSNTSSYGDKLSDSSEKLFNTDQSEIVQLKPQYVNLKLGLNQIQKINFSYKRAADYPLDLYYLMDSSKSMDDHRNALATLGETLVTEMRKLSSDFRIGFGSFGDKPVLPFGHGVKMTNYADLYAFKNIMPLSNNTKTFSENVRDTPKVINRDTAEAGFDAIMQATVCEDIGWRKNARRILVYSTDGSFHIACDGKLGGILKPNDGECHLDENGYYNMSHLLDYPSVGQLNVELRKQNIVLIFAVLKNAMVHYQPMLTKIFTGSSCVNLQEKKNIVQLIKDQYEIYTDGVIFKADNAPKYLKLTYYSKCLNESGPLMETHVCNNLKIGSTVDFEVDVELKECPKDPKEWTKSFTIQPLGINEYLTVNLTLLCDCPCEHRGNTHYEINSTKCNKHGTYSCGLCNCGTLHYGRKCECDHSSITTGASDQYKNSCKPKNSNIECSGRGQCVCGVCRCERGHSKGQEFTGQFCECDSSSCPYNSEGLVCSGPSHGVCSSCESKCLCKDGWGGDACDCRNDMDCIAPNSSIPCSGRGTCKCGKCSCEVNDKGQPYYGLYCESCLDCKQKCKEFEKCVKCRAIKKYKNITTENCNDCYSFELTFHDEIEFNRSIHENRCFVDNEDGCEIQFIYKYVKGNEIAVETLNKPKCPTFIEQNVIEIASSLSLAIVLIGLAFLLAWKIVTHVHDKREYVKFEEDKRKARWNNEQNPIYVPSVSNFQNPLYNARDSKID